ncbi:hypothetical protein ES702_01474 [subsurface metagenome]
MVLDPGYASTRAGFAGEDCPKSIVPSYYASYNDSKLFGDHIIDVPRDDVAIKNPYSKDGVVEDWDTAEELWKYTFASKLTGVRSNKALQRWLNDPKLIPDLQKAMAEEEDTHDPLVDHPLFLTEPNWNPTKNREKAIEIALEKWAAPAFYTSKQGVLAAFSMGKSTALVIDIGASQMSVAAVHDGMILKKSVMKSHLGGDYLSSQVRNVLNAHDPPIDITPHYLVKSKQPVEPGQPANVVLKQYPAGHTPPQSSFRRYQEEKMILEFKELCLQTWTTQTPFRGQGEAIARDQYAHPFEFPDGYNQTFSSERFKIVESLFDAQCYTSPPAGSYEASLFPAPEQNQTLPGLVKMCINQCDVDLRPTFLSNVVLAGGGSMIKGLPDRITQTLTAMYPSTKVRVTAPGMSVERKFASYIGGSIVGSLGTFHQMWISKKEYDEHGASIVEKRCK